MDLGFSSSNQAVGNLATSTLLAATSAQEEALQSSIAAYDSLLDAKDSELELLRERRLAQMKATQLQRSKWREMGHGTYEELGIGGEADVAKSFFAAAKQSERLVVHFYRPTTRQCDYFHRALEQLAPKHLETKFVKINVEGCDDVREGGAGVGAKYLVEKLGVVVMPTLLIVKDRKAVHQLRGFDELGGRVEFTVNELAYVLGGHGALTRRGEEEEEEPGFVSGEERSNVEGVNSLKMMFGGGNHHRGVRRGGYEDFDEDE